MDDGGRRAAANFPDVRLGPTEAGVGASRDAPNCGWDSAKPWEGTNDERARRGHDWRSMKSGSLKSMLTAFERGAGVPLGGGARVRPPVRVAAAGPHRHSSGATRRRLLERHAGPPAHGHSGPGVQPARLIVSRLHARRSTRPRGPGGSLPLDSERHREVRGVRAAAPRAVRRPRPPGGSKRAA